MKRFFTFLKTELKFSLRDMNMVIFAVIMPLIVFIILCIVYGAKPAYDGANYTALEQSFGAVSAIAICASGLMGLPLAVSVLREMKILKRLRVTPVSPVFILGVELTMYGIYCALSLATLSIVALLWGVKLHRFVLGISRQLGTYNALNSVNRYVGGRYCKEYKTSKRYCLRPLFPDACSFRDDASD